MVNISQMAVVLTILNMPSGAEKLGCRAKIKARSSSWPPESATCCGDLETDEGEEILGATEGRQKVTETGKCKWRLRFHWALQVQDLNSVILHRNQKNIYMAIYILIYISAYIYMQIFCRYFTAVQYWLCWTACRILVPWPWIEPRPGCHNRQPSPNRWTARKSPKRLRPSDCRTLVLGPYLAWERVRSQSLRDLSSRRKKKTSLQETPGLDFALVDSRQRVWL